MDPGAVLVEDPSGRIVAAAAAYLKSHSMGEYVFDHAWADAYERAGGRYYPKLQVAAPFTPATGRRLLVAADAPEGAREALIGGLRELRKQTRASSLHVTFPTADDARRLERAGFLVRHGEQFHFLCDGFASFDDFWQRSRHASASRSSASGATRWVPTSRSSGLRVLQSTRALESVLRLLHRHRLAQMGPALSDPGFFDRIGASMPERILW